MMFSLQYGIGPDFNGKNEGSEQQHVLSLSMEMFFLQIFSFALIVTLAASMPIVNDKVKVNLVALFLICNYFPNNKQNSTSSHSAQTARFVVFFLLEKFFRMVSTAIHCLHCN